jgi:hypothetical protein
MARSDPQVWTPEKKPDVEAALRSSRTRDEAAAKLNRGIGALDHACRTYGFKPAAMLHGRSAPSLGGAASYVDPGPLVIPPEAALVTPGPMVEEGSAAPGRDSFIAYGGDFHFPQHDKPLWDSWLRWIQFTQPDEIILSELGEWESLSRHGGNWGAMWDADKAAVRHALLQLRSVSPRSRIIVQQSNHDTRLERLLQTCLPQFCGSMTIPNELKFSELGIEWVGERVVLRRGRIKSLHGHQLATGPGGMLPKMHTQRAVQLYGEPGVIVVYFHTHKHQAWSEPHEAGPKRAENIACMRTLFPTWLAGRQSGWHHQFAGAYVSASGPSNLYVVDAENGAFTWEGWRFAPGRAPVRVRAAA